MHYDKRLDVVVRCRTREDRDEIEIAAAGTEIAISRRSDEVKARDKFRHMAPQEADEPPRCQIQGVVDQFGDHTTSIALVAHPCSGKGRHVVVQVQRGLGQHCRQGGPAPLSEPHVQLQQRRLAHG